MACIAFSAISSRTTISILIFGTLVLLKLVDLVVGLRVTREQEIEGLDITQHGEEGYDFGS